MKTLTEKQAYEAMFYFLDQRFNKLQEGAIASLLGDMSTLSDGKPVDPRISTYWNQAIEFALRGDIVSKMQLTKKK